jgi:hypothetical protein
MVVNTCNAPAMTGAALAAIIVAGVLALLSVILVIVRSLTRRAANQLQTHVEMTGQRLVRGPEYGSFRGAEKAFGRVKCDGAIAATDEHLLLQKAIGGRVEVPFREVVGVEVCKAFLGSWRAGQPVLVLMTRDENRIGFFVRDTDAWVGLIREHMTDSEQTTHA